jgi:hypothetical protein
MDRNEDEINDMIIELAEMIREESFFAISSTGDRYNMKALGESSDISDSMASAMFAIPQLAMTILSAVRKYNALQN